MSEPFEIVHGVLDQYRGLPKRLHEIHGKSPEWWASHGRRPKTEDAIASGNVSEVEHYMRYVRKFEAAAQGSGRMLSHSVYIALESEFCGEPDDCDQVELELQVIDETCDVQKWLARCDIETASRRDLVQFIQECKEAEDAIAGAKAQATARLKTSGVSTNGNGAKR